MDMDMDMDMDMEHGPWAWRMGMGMGMGMSMDTPTRWPRTAPRHESNPQSSSTHYPPRPPRGPSCRRPAHSGSVSSTFHPTRVASQPTRYIRTRLSIRPQVTLRAGPSSCGKPHALPRLCTGLLLVLLSLFRRAIHMEPRSRVASSTSRVHLFATYLLCFFCVCACHMHNPVAAASSAVAAAWRAGSPWVRFPIPISTICMRGSRARLCDAPCAGLHILGIYLCVLLSIQRWCRVRVLLHGLVRGSV